MNKLRSNGRTFLTAVLLSAAIMPLFLVWLFGSFEVVAVFILLVLILGLVLFVL